MSPKDEALTIQSPAVAEDLSDGLAFLNAHYQKAFNVLPSPPDHLIVARYGNCIAGTIGVNFWHPGSGLRLAHLYTFDYAHAPLPVDLSRTAEFGKWACETRGVSGHLVHAAICFALSHQKTSVWCEHTAAVNRACKRFGIIFHAVTDATLNPSRIEDYHRKFYEDNDARLYMSDLAQARVALEHYLNMY